MAYTHTRTAELYRSVQGNIYGTKMYSESHSSKKKVMIRETLRNCAETYSKCSITKANISL